LVRIEILEYLFRLIHDARIIEARNAFQKPFDLFVIMSMTEQPTYDILIEQWGLAPDDVFRNLMVLPHAARRHPFDEEGFRSKTQRGTAKDKGYKEDHLEVR